MGAGGPGGWRKGSGALTPQYLPLSDKILAAHLSGELHVGLYPLKADNRCHWVAADFDGPAALLDALSYLKAARALGALASSLGTPVNAQLRDLLHSTATKSNAMAAATG